MVDEGAFFLFLHRKGKMAKKLWQTTTQLNPLIESYTTGDDLVCDQQLVEVDVLGSLAHAQMLFQQNLILEADWVQIQAGLGEILNKYHQGKFVVGVGDEDVHTKVENDLTKKYPQAGAKLHTGRSRNDQVLTDIRLFSKQKLQQVIETTMALATVFCEQAQKFETQPLVGMTHMQPAMLSSVGLWLASFAESLIDDLSLLQGAMGLNDQSPLGSGAGYGVTLPLDRELTAEVLGFAKVQNNALYCQNSKGKIEATTLHALTQVMGTLNKFASDCLLFTTEPFSFISFDQNLGSGSSIMPQKQNWDALELMRANYHQLVSSLTMVLTSQANLPSGYNRDSQLIKEKLMQGFKLTLSSLKVAQLFVESLKINQEQVEKHLPKEIFAAHWAYVLTQSEKLPFRQAYQFVKNNLANIPDFSPIELVMVATTLGSTGNLQLSEIMKKLGSTKRRRD